MISEPGGNNKKLYDEFSSVFTKEDCENLPDLGKDIPVEAPPLMIQVKGVRKLLEAINPHKA
ncbi:hypothetical protein DPMN_061221 [Dreissena polymorpha]|uniref:Uncharacterized protein n=1 Tax=Dreissena polymorpha TaxID=45954 RepID=A0A9D4C772_DREPO|nr:hypothetical protein DPMN_061221 [Dreissena polymorpha]